MLPDMDQLYGRMAQVAHELQALQTQWDLLLREVQQIRHTSSDATRPVQSPVANPIPSYGAQYTVIGQPYGTSAFETGLGKAVDGTHNYSSAAVGARIGRQSEHTAYGRGL